MIIILLKAIVCLTNYDFSHLFFVFFLDPCFKFYFLTPVESSTKSQVKLRCNITSHFKPRYSDIYLLKNGFKKLHLNEDQISIATVPLNNETSNGSLIQPYKSILQYQINDNYSAQGFYQCAVSSKMFRNHEARSQKLQLQFQGNIFPLVLLFELKHWKRFLAESVLWRLLSSKYSFTLLVIPQFLIKQWLQETTFLLSIH